MSTANRFSLSHSGLTKLAKENKWAQQVIRVNNSANKNFNSKCAFRNFQQKQSLKALFEELDTMISFQNAHGQRDEQSEWEAQHKLFGIAIGAQHANEKAECVAQRSLILSTDAQDEPEEPRVEKSPFTVPSIRIPKMTPKSRSPREPRSALSPRKRPSLEIATELQSPRKKGRMTPQGEGFDFTPKPTLQTGDRVRVVAGAKKKFLNKEGTIEKFLAKKQKWGIKLSNGARIALEQTCLQVLVRASPVATIRISPPRARTISPPRKALSMQPRISLANYLPVLPINDTSSPSTSPQRPKSPFHFKVDVFPAKREEVEKFRNSFPEDSRPRKYSELMVQACVRGRPDIIMHLVLNNKVSVDTKIRDGSEGNALHIAIQNSQEECALCLLEMGITATVTTANKCSALHMASMCGMTSLVVALCQAGVNMNTQDNKGQTALMMAAMRGHDGAAGVLIDNGADVEIHDNMHKTALSVAMSSSSAGHKKVQERLFNRMYEINNQETKELRRAK